MKIIMLAVLALGGSVAHAALTSTLTGPGEIKVGNSATFVATVEVTPEPGYDVFAMNDLNYAFYSGDGQVWDWIVPDSELVGGTLKSYTFSASFTYLATGTFEPYFIATETSTEFHTDWVAPPGYQQNSGYNVQVSYACGPLNTQTCYRDEWIDTSRWINPGYTPHGESYGVESSTGARTALVVSIPEPGTYALMLAGLATVGLVARRRKALTLQSDAPR